MTIKISQLNSLTTVWGNILIPVVSNISSANVTYRANIDQVKNYINIDVNSDLASNVASLNFLISTSNVVMRSYVDGQISAANTGVTAANVGMQGYVDFANTIQQSYINGQITAANVGVTAANVGMRGYVDSRITVANAGVTAANLGMRGYVDFANTIQQAYVDGQISAANAGVTAANVGMIGYVDSRITVANAGVAAANVGMRGYVDFANTIQQSYINGQISAANAGVITANVGMIGYVEQGNAIIKAYVDGQIAAANVGSYSNAKVATYLSNSNGNLTLNPGTGSFILVGNILPLANNISNIGSVGATFNTVHARSTSAQYADIAERYLSDQPYEPGTVLHFGGVAEVSVCDTDHCTRVAGVVSTAPAFTMNDKLIGENVLMVALLGRVPCKVQGSISKGDMLVSAGNGRARAESNPKVGAVIGKALENFNGSEGSIEIVVGRV